MPETFKRVSPGEPLSIAAETWNRLMGMGRRVEGATRAALGDRTDGSDPLSPVLVVSVRNSSGATLPPMSILTPSAAVLNPDNEPSAAQRSPVIDAAAPASSDDAIVICFDSIEYQRIGRAVVAGVTVANVEVTDAAHRYARPVPGDTSKLVSAESGPAYLLVPVEVGTALVYVQLGGTGSGGAFGGGSGAGCAFLDALTEDDCYTLSLNGGTAIDLADGLTIDGTHYLASFNPAVPSLTLTPSGDGSGGVGIVGKLGTCACPCATFVFSRNDFFTEELPDSVCDRLFTVKVCQDCCPIEGWAGAGWYCVRNAGSDADPVAAELLDENRCDASLEIVSGPYESQAAAEAVCSGEGETVQTPCCDDPLPAVLHVTVTSSSGTWAGAMPPGLKFDITWNPSLQIWENNNIGTCTMNGFPIRWGMNCEGHFGSNILIVDAAPVSGSLCTRPVSLAYSGVTSFNCCGGGGTPCTGTLTLTITE